jgi:predicted regulator of Ras-like GTPase activity (Roadblock/LC7/MglB family)
MNNKLKNQPEPVQQELKALADRIPRILSVALISVDGFRLGFYSRNPNVRERRRAEMEATGRSSESEDEDRVAAMSGASSQWSELISSQLGVGEWMSSVITGKKGTIFQHLVNEEIVLFAFAPPETSIDAILPELKAAGERLLQI